MSNGHIFGQVVTLYQICCTKTYKAFSVKLSAFFIRRTPPVIFGFALKSNILNTPFLSSRQLMRTSPFIFKACDAATQSSFILTSSFVPSFAGGSLCCYKIASFIFLASEFFISALFYRRYRGFSRVSSLRQASKVTLACCLKYNALRL